MILKLQIIEDPELEDTEISIKCPKIDDTIDKISDIIRSFYIRILVKKDNESIIINVDEIYYFEFVDNRLFAYTKDEIYEVNYKLHELVNLLSKASFIQTSRTILLNINKIKSVQALVNGRIMAVFDNGEKTIITRVYAGDFKRKIKE